MPESDVESSLNLFTWLLLKVKPFVPLLMVILGLIFVFGAIWGVFLFRSPVLIVTDSSFMAVYGPKRLKKMESSLSSKLFRRIIPVYVDEYAGPDIISVAAEDAFQSPLAVLFPYRYMEGAGYYKENHPEIPVYITTGRNQTSNAKETLGLVRTDIKTDMYRAGLCAAMLAGEGSILFVSDGTVPSENREAFIEGLRDQDYTKDPVWGNANSSFTSGSDLSCAVIAGPAGSFFETRPETPVILFSWADPDFTPRSVKVIFNDSPYTLAFKGFSLFSLIGGGGELSISSVPTVFKDRIEEEADFQRLTGLVEREFQNK
jgi:hypothetical protein